MITIVEYDKEQKQITIHENVNWREFRSVPSHLYWWDLFEATHEELQCLSEQFHFHPLAIEDCVQDVHYPKVDFYDTYLYLVIHGVDVDRTEIEGFAPKELDIFLGQNYLVTFHKKPARSTDEILRRCRENAPLFEHGLDFLLYAILDILVSNYLPVLETIEDRLDNIEEVIFEKPDPKILREILNVKRTLMRLKKTVFPQREVINHLARNEYAFVSQKAQIYFRDIYDMLYRMAEMTESFRDVSTALVETYLSTVSNRMNEIMKVLALVTTILMPMTVITGIYGMNFEHMPELKWWTGYYMVLGVLGVVGLIMVVLFKWKKWI